MMEGHGDDSYRYKVSIRADFSSNVLYGPLHAGLRAHLQEKIDTVTHYPEASAQSLQAIVAEAYGVPPDWVLVTNGVTEAIYLAAQAFRHLKTATILAPAFAEYEDACRLHGLDINWLSWDSLTPDTRLWPDAGLPNGLVFLSHPNNPTGGAIPVIQLLGLFIRNPKTVFVIDESYIEFTLTTESVIPYLIANPNVLVLRSLTKSCSIPGLRVGFAIGSPTNILRLKESKMPWSVNRLAIEAGLYIFSHWLEFIVPIEQLITEKEHWCDELLKMANWTVYESDTHFFLMETDPALCTAARLKEYLITRHGLLIRDASNFRGLTPNHFRVACQSAEHNRLLTEALRECSRTGL